MTDTIILRPLQERAVAAVRTAMRTHRRVLLVAPTGFGKTAVSSVLIGRAVARGKRVLFIVHRREIVRATAKRLAKIGVRCAIVMADEAAPSDESVLVCSIQTLSARGEFPPADLIFWDEAHHCAAKSYREIAAHYPNALHFGLTATPERADGTGLSDMFDTLVVAATPAELVAENLLVACDVIGPEMRMKDMADSPVAAWTQHAAGRRTVVFCANVQHAEDTSREFVGAGVTSEWISGETPKAARDSILERFDRGEILVLVNVYVLTEGWDSPPTEVCVLARGCGSAATYIQMVGRVLRTAPGKTRATVIDLCGNWNQHGLPTDEREFSLEGKPISNKQPAEAIRQCPDCAAVFRPVAVPAVCPECSFAFPPPAPPAITRQTMGVASGANATIQQQRATWEALTNLCRTRGYKPGWAAYQFKAKHGFWPPRAFPRVAC